MGAPLTPNLLTLRHGPPNSLCRSVVRNYQFPCQGNEIVGKVWGREGKGNKGGQQNWSPHQSVTLCFFLVFSMRLPPKAFPLFFVTIHFGGKTYSEKILAKIVEGRQLVRPKKMAGKRLPIRIGINLETGFYPSWLSLLHLGNFLVHTYARVGLYLFATVI